MVDRPILRRAAQLAQHLAPSSPHLVKKSAKSRLQMQRPSLSLLRIRLCTSEPPSVSPPWFFFLREALLLPAKIQKDPEKNMPEKIPSSWNPERLLGIDSQKPFSGGPKRCHRLIYKWCHCPSQSLQKFKAITSNRRWVPVGRKSWQRMLSFGLLLNNGGMRILIRLFISVLVQGLVLAAPSKWELSGYPYLICLARSPIFPPCIYAYLSRSAHSRGRVIPDSTCMDDALQQSVLWARL